MRELIQIVESFGTSNSLYHGLSIDSLWMVIRSGHLTTSFNGWGHAGPEGVCLTRSFRVAVDHSGTQTQNLDESFFAYFGLGDPPELSYAVLEFDRSRIPNEIIPYNDFGNEEDGVEEEERVIGDLSLAALTAIYIKPDDIKTFVRYAIEAHKKGGQEYDKEFHDIMAGLLRDPRLRPF